MELTGISLLQLKVWPDIFTVRRKWLSYFHSCFENNADIFCNFTAVSLRREKLETHKKTAACLQTDQGNDNVKNMFWNT